MFLTIIKAVAEVACVVGSEVIVGGIVKNAASPSRNKALNACSKITTVCLAGVLGTAAGKYADESIDEIANTVKKLTSKESDSDGTTEKHPE